MSEEILNQAQEAIRNGKNELATELFTKAVAYDPGSEDAWLGLGFSTTKREVQIRCFQKVLEINPDNTIARMRLAQLTSAKKRVKGSNLGYAVIGIMGLSILVFICLLSYQLRQLQNEVTSLQGETALEMKTPTIPVIPVATQTPIPPTIQKTATAPLTITKTETSFSTPDIFVPTPFAIVQEVPTPAVFSPQPIVGGLLDRYFENSHIIGGASQNMREGSYIEAILDWDQVIEQVPYFGYPYYERALAYYIIAKENQKVESERADYLRRAFEDINSSIQYGPVSGDKYYLRSQIYQYFARSKGYREESLPFYELAFEDLQEADRLKHGLDPYSVIQSPLLLNYQGKCQEALEAFGQIAEQNQDTLLNPELNAGVAESYYCLGEYEKALIHMDVSLSLRYEVGKELRKAYILYSMGRTDDALSIMNRLLENKPYFNGDRYYFRALIYYDMGEYDLARADIEFGATQVWGMDGIGSLVLGMLTIHEGNITGGQELVGFGESTLSFASLPIINRARQELGLPLIEMTGFTTVPPSLESILTAPPFVEVTVTPLPNIRGSSEQFLFATSDFPVPFSGTGPFTLPPSRNGYLIYFFPPEALDPNAAKILTFHLITEGKNGAAGIFLNAAKLEDGGGMRGSDSVELHWGQNPYIPPEGYIDARGGIHISIRNNTEEPIQIENLILEMAVHHANGTVSIYLDPDVPVVIETNLLPTPTPISIESLLATVEPIRFSDPHKVLELLIPVYRNISHPDFQKMAIRYLAEAEVSLGHYNLATGYYEKLWTLEPTGDTLVLLAENYSAGGYYECALIRYRELANWEGVDSTDFQEIGELGLDYILQLVSQDVICRENMYEHTQ